MAVLQFIGGDCCYKRKLYKSLTVNYPESIFINRPWDADRNRCSISGVKLFNLENMLIDIFVLFKVLFNEWEFILSLLTIKILVIVILIVKFVVTTEK